jgi:phage baseplate assembly protein V
MLPELTQAEMDRRLSRVLFIGTVESVDTGSARARVAMRGATTAPLPWLVPRAGEVRGWSAPSVGEQVMVAAPDGDWRQGVILGALYQGLHPAPSSNAKAVIFVFPDGAELAYDAQAHELHATLPPAGKARVVAPAGVELVGDVQIQGSLNVAGSVGAGGAIQSAASVFGPVVLDAKGPMEAIRQVYNGHTHVLGPKGIEPPPQQM